jgi:NAD+ diphosphatase
MNPLAFTGNPLERANYRRMDADWLAAQRQSGWFLPFWQNRPYLVENRAGFLPWQAQWQDKLCVFLGLEGTQPYFAVDLAGESEPSLGQGAFQEMRSAAFVLPARDTAVAGHAKALLDWHKRHGFCPNCGNATEPTDGGNRRICPRCRAEHFPRTDPVVIMLPIFRNQDGSEECLVGRNFRFPPGLHSAFAGFVETGESMEEAVRRELWEEVNLAVGAISYHGTQPWPFPSSLMLGCYAQALSRDFRIDRREIEAACWLSKAEVLERLNGTIHDDIKLPVAIAIAHHLILDWAHN